MNGRLHVNPWRFRAWNQRDIALGGMRRRTLPRSPLLEAFRVHNAAVEPGEVSRPELEWLAAERFLLPEPLDLEHPFAPQLGFFSFWPGRPEERLERLAGATVGLLGVGGLGSQIAHLLAAAGVGRLLLLDRDTVEVRNLNRQLYDTADFGRHKVRVTAERLRRLRPGIEIEEL